MQRTSKSLELLKQKIEQYRKVFDALFFGDQGQHKIVEQVFVALGLMPIPIDAERIYSNSNSIERAGKVL